MDFSGGFLVMVGLIAVDRGIRWAAAEIARAIRERPPA